MGWLTSESQGTACLCFPSAGIRGLFHDTQFFYVDSGDQIHVF